MSCLQVVRREVGVLLHAAGLLHLVQLALELLADALAFRGLDAFGLFHDHVGVHHDQPAVGVIDEARVVGRLDHALGGLLVQADVEDRLHHAGHGLARARAHGDQQRVVRVAELLAHDLLDVLQARGNLGVEARRDTCPCS